MITTLQRITSDLSEMRKLKFKNAGQKDMSFMEDEINANLPSDFKNETEGDKRRYDSILNAILVKSIYNIEEPLEDVIYFLHLNNTLGFDKYGFYIYLLYRNVKRDKLFTYKNMIPMYQVLDNIVNNKEKLLKENNDSFSFFFSENILKWLFKEFGKIFNAYSLNRFSKRVSISSNDYLFTVVNDTPENIEINKIFFSLIESVNNHVRKEEENKLIKIVFDDISDDASYNFNLASYYIISAYVYQKSKKNTNKIFEFDITSNHCLASLLFPEKYPLFLQENPLASEMIGMEGVERQINKDDFSNIKLANKLLKESSVTLLALKFLTFSNSDDYIQQFKYYLFEKGYTKKGWNTLLNEDVKYLRHVDAMRVENRGSTFLYNNGIKRSNLPNNRIMKKLLLLLGNNDDDNFITSKNRHSLANIFIPYFKDVIGKHSNPSIINFSYSMIENSSMDLPDLKEKMTPESACSILDQVADYCNYILINDEILFNQCSLRTLCDRSKLWHENDKLIKTKSYNYNKEEITEIILNNVCFSQVIETRQLVDEGVSMHHCVASYNEACHAGIYVVYHAQRNNDRATLGINKKNGIYEIDQLYGLCNSVVDSGFHDAAKMLIDLLNMQK